MLRLFMQKWTSVFFSACLHFPCSANSTLILLLGTVLPLVQWGNLIQRGLAISVPSFSCGVDVYPKYLD